MYSILENHQPVFQNTMEFKPYDSIPNMKYAEPDPINIEEYIALEKIHGANFSLYLDDIGIRAGKRSAWLPIENPGFYGCETIIKKLTPCMFLLLSLLRKKTEKGTEKGTEKEKIDNIQVFGELFGGRYHHKDVSKNDTVRAIQKEVQYSPNIEFMAFDLRINGIYCDLPVKEMLDLMTKSGIQTVPVVSTGSLSDMLKLDPTLDTPVPSILGYPSIEKNPMEGYVIRPSMGKHKLFKLKNPLFLETPVNTVIDRTNIQGIYMELCGYITMGRIVNAKSKMDFKGFSSISECLRLINKDIEIDIPEDLRISISSLDLSSKDQLTRQLNRKICESIKATIK